MIDIQKLESIADGQWGFIFARLAPSLSEAIECDAKKHCPCPVHGGTDGFKFFKDYESTGGGVCNTCGCKKSGISLLMWVNTWSFKEALFAVADMLGIEDNGEYTAPSIKPRIVEPKKISAEQIKEDQRRTDNIRRIWKEECINIMDPKAEPLRLYMVRRGLEYDVLPQTTVKFHPSLPYYDGEGKVLGKYPAMVAVVYDKDGKACTLHRTYLTQNGHKAPVPDAKKIMAYASTKSMVGGAIWLERLDSKLSEKGNGKKLAIAEGIETAIAVKLGTSSQFPVWSVISATMLEKFVVPEGVEEVLVFADKDRAVVKPGGETIYPGQDAAKNLINRLRSEGITAKGYIPTVDIPEEQKSVDWADMYKWYGKSALKTNGVKQHARKAA